MCNTLYYYHDLGLIKRSAKFVRPDNTAVNRGSRNTRHCTFIHFLEATGTSVSLNYRSNDLCACNLCLLHSDMLVIDQDVKGIFIYSIYKFLMAILNNAFLKFRCGNKVLHQSTHNGKVGRKYFRTKSDQVICDLRQVQQQVTCAVCVAPKYFWYKLLLFSSYTYMAKYAN